MLREQRWRRLQLLVARCYPTDAADGDGLLPRCRPHRSTDAAVETGIASGPRHLPRIWEIPHVLGALLLSAGFRDSLGQPQFLVMTQERSGREASGAKSQASCGWRPLQLRKRPRLEAGLGQGSCMNRSIDLVSPCDLGVGFGYASPIFPCNAKDPLAS